MLRMLKKTLGRNVVGRNGVGDGREPGPEKEHSKPKKHASNKKATPEVDEAGQISFPGPWMKPSRGPLTAEERQKLLAEHKKDIALVDILSRIVDSGAVSTAAIHTQQGKKGRNQDAMVVWEEFLNREETTFVGVFDGHGPFGHLVAKRVRDTLPSILTDYLSVILEKTGIKGEPPGPVALDTMELENLKAAFKVAFLEMDSELRSHPTIDSFCSGTTAVCAVKHHDHLFVSNLGDSRIIMGSQGENGKMVATQISVDLKPDLPDEKRRIRASNGRVFALPDEPEVTRVWLPHEDTPGLAMARAFGDLCLKDYGVISAPDVTHRRLTDRDKFVVLASDGIWDVLENEEVVQLVASHAPRKDAAIKVVQTAVRAWREKYPFSKTDDCACVVLFFDGVDKESPKLEVAVAEAKNPQGEVENPGRSLRSLADLGLLTKPPERVDESLVVRADSVVDLSAVSRAMDDEDPGDDDDGSALIVRADSVTTIVRKL